jgi:hypothetical protein
VSSRNQQNVTSHARLGTSVKHAASDEHLARRRRGTGGPAPPWRRPRARAAAGVTVAGVAVILTLRLTRRRRQPTASLHGLADTGPGPERLARGSQLECYDAGPPVTLTGPGPVTGPRHPNSSPSRTVTARGKASDPLARRIRVMPRPHDSDAGVASLRATKPQVVHSNLT